MKFALLVGLMILGACSSGNWAELYPHCFHDKEEVQQRCYEMNEAGTNANAAYVEQLMREGGNP